MKSNSYWESRQAQRMFEYMESAEKAADEIANLYKKAALYLDLSIDDIFEKYRDKYGLSDEEARKLLENLPDDATIQELKKVLENDPKNKNKQELLKKLESPAYDFRIRRLQELRNRLNEVMENIYNQESQISSSYYIEQASDSYYKSIFDVQQYTGLGFAPPAVTAKLIETVINSKWSGKNYSERIWTNTRELASTIKQELLLGLITGKTNREVAKDIEMKFASGASNARRLVRTESNYLCSQMQKESYERLGIEKYRFLATLDLRTSTICRALDGVVKKLSEAVVGLNFPPMHPWCRSTIISIIDDKVLSKLKRKALDPATGKTINVPANMTYAQWYKEYVEGNPTAQLEEKKVKNRSTDRKQYAKYKKVLGDIIPKSLEEFQEMKYTDTEKWKYIKLDYRRRYELISHPELKLPNAENAVLPEAKFTKYLFGGEHPEGLAKGKAFESRLGYSIDNWKKLQSEIKESALKYPATFKDNNGYGDRYEQKIILYGNKNTPANVIVGWLCKLDGTTTMSSTYIKEVD